MKRLLRYYVIIIYLFFPNKYRCLVIGYSCFNFKVEQDTRPYILDHTSVHFYFFDWYMYLYFFLIWHFFEIKISPVSMTTSSTTTTTTTTLSRIAFWKRKEKRKHYVDGVSTFFFISKCHADYAFNPEKYTTLTINQNKIELPCVTKNKLFLKDTCC